MADEHFGALLLCFVVGFIPWFFKFLVHETTYTPAQLRTRKFINYWFVFWTTPAFITLYLKGILG